MKNKYIFIIGSLLAFFSCDNNQKSTIKAEDTVTINTNESKTFDASNSIQFIKYIPLETTDESLIKHVEKIYTTDSNIIIFDEKLNEIFLFGNDGKYIRKFGKKGIGPGEYSIFNDVFFEKSTGLIYAHEAIKRSMHVYDLSGNLKQEISTKNFWFRSFCKINDDYWIYTGYKNEKTQYSIMKVDGRFNDIIKGFLPQKEFFRTIIHTTFMQNGEGDLFFISPYSNMVYQINNDDLIPFLKINFGDKTIPYDKIPQLSNEIEYNELVYGKNYMGDISDFLFCKNKFYFSFSNMSNESTLYSACFDFEKKTVDIYDRYSEYKSADFPLNHIVFTQPKGISEDKLIYLIDPYNLDEQDLQTLQKANKISVDIDSNPILFFVKD